MKNTVRIGYIGEQIVVDLLPGSRMVNRQSEKHRPYDIIWGDVRIDVKTTGTTATVNGEACIFSPHITKRHNGIVLVYVAILDSGTYFWVEKYRVGAKTYVKLTDSIPKDKLQEEILKIADKPYKVLGAKKSPISVDEYTEKKIEAIMLMNSLLCTSRTKAVAYAVDNYIKYLSNKENASKPNGFVPVSEYNELKDKYNKLRATLKEIAN